MKHTTKN